MGHENSKQLLLYAEEKRESEAIKLIETRYFLDTNYVNNYGDTALHIASTNNLPDLAEKLIQNHANVNKKNKFNSTPLHLACKVGNVQIARILLKNKSDPNIQGQYKFNCLTIAAGENNLAIVRLLFEFNAHIQDSTLLFASAHENGDEMCRLILSHGGNVNSTDKYGNTALMQASARGNDKVVEVLVSREWVPHIEIDKQNQFGWSALHFAYASIDSNQINKHNIINILLRKGATLDLKNDDGVIPSNITPQSLKTQPPNKKRKINNNCSEKQYYNNETFKNYQYYCDKNSTEEKSVGEEENEQNESISESQYTTPKQDFGRKRKLVFNGS